MGGVALTGWTLGDRQGHVFGFDRTTLPPGGRLTGRIGRGTRAARHRYWGRFRHVWDNRTEVATLRTKSGAVIDCPGGPTRGPAATPSRTATTERLGHTGEQPPAVEGQHEAIGLDNTGHSWPLDGHWMTDDS